MGFPRSTLTASTFSGEPHSSPPEHTVERPDTRVGNGSHCPEDVPVSETGAGAQALPADRGTTASRRPAPAPQREQLDTTAYTRFQHSRGRTGVRTGQTRDRHRAASCRGNRTGAIGRCRRPPAVRCAHGSQTENRCPGRHFPVGSIDLAGCADRSADGVSVVAPASRIGSVISSPVSL